jgi:hypothetical protein
MEQKQDELQPKNKEETGESTVSEQNNEEDDTRDRSETNLSEDPEDWIRNNILGKNMLLKAGYMSKLGVKVTESLSKDNQKKLNDYYEQDKKEREEEEKEIENENLTMDKTYSKGDFSINFFLKTDDEMRNSYINRLIGMGIMKTAPSKKHQTMIIFDWDDTLLCTTFLGSLGFLDIPAEILATLKPLDESAAKLLAKSITYGDTFIITNAAEGWVQYSSKLFLPKTHEVLVEKNIRIISARSGYEELFPGDCQRWKLEAFLDIKKEFDRNVITNLICLGDSHIEIDAAHVLAQQFTQTMIKTIKFREHPRPDELIKQQDLVSEKFEQIYTSIRNLTIRLEKKAPGV